MQNWLVYSFFAWVILAGCHGVPIKTMDIREQNDADKYHHLLHKELYLQNRIKNCDSAIVYMKHIISPISVDIYRYEWNEIFIDTRIPGEDLKLINSPTGQRRGDMFHVAPGCLVGMELNELLGFLCNTDDRQQVLRYNKARIDSNMNDNWYIYVAIGKIPSFVTVIGEGIVKSTYFIRIPEPE